MKVTIELSLYPLKENYTQVIIEFIKILKSHKDINVHCTAMSTYVTGEYEETMQIVTMELGKVYQLIPDSSTVMKIIPKDLNIGNGFLNF